jgi:mono/diheme cytochrome c family protein
MQTCSLRHAGLGSLLLLAASIAAQRSVAASPGAARPGQAIYEAQCAACHQPDGAGAAGLAPPLRDHLAHYLTTEDGRAYLARILISGMVGPITVDGAPFNGLMPSFAKLDDATLAETISYVLLSMNTGGAAITPQTIAEARKTQPTPVGTRKLRQKIVSSGN